MERFLTHEAQTVEDAEKRLHAEQARHKAEAKEAAEKRDVETPTSIHPGSDVGKDSLKKNLETAKTSVEASRNAGKQ